MSETKIPPEFPSRWHFDAHLEGLERELVGRIARKAELEGMSNLDEGVLEQADADIATVKAELARYGRGQKAATKRPAAKGETRD